MNGMKSNDWKRPFKWFLNHFLLVWSIVGACILVVHFVFTWHRNISNGFDWQIIEGIATWVLAGGVIFAFMQIRETRKSSNAQIAMEVYKELRNDDMLATVRYIYNLPKTNRSLHIKTNIYDIEDLIGKLDLLGLLVQEGIIDEKIAIEGYAGVTAVRCWYFLANHIVETRKTRKYYCQNFEDFTHRCCKYFQSSQIQVGFSNEANGIFIENLTPVLLNKKDDPDIYPRTRAEIEGHRKDTTNGQS